MTEWVDDMTVTEICLGILYIVTAQVQTQVNINYINTALKCKSIYNFMPVIFIKSLLSIHKGYNTLIIVMFNPSTHHNKMNWGHSPFELSRASSHVHHLPGDYRVFSL